MKVVSDSLRRQASTSIFYCLYLNRIFFNFYLIAIFYINPPNLINSCDLVMYAKERAR